MTPARTEEMQLRPVLLAMCVFAALFWIGVIFAIRDFIGWLS